MKLKIKVIISLFVFTYTISSCSTNSSNPNTKKYILKNKDTSDVQLIPPQLKVGAEVLSDYLPQLENKKVAVVANHTSIISGKHLVDTLRDLKIDVLRVFAPEHGFRGDFDAGAIIDHSKDKATGLPIFSLHGKTKKPTNESLKGIDVVIFDIQDIGVRFYTYLSTLHYVMEACAENNVKLIVLDRPNPNAHYVDGPILKKQFKSFVGLHPVPVVYGMTIGEYAKMINGEFWLKDSVQADLSVVQLKNWDRNQEYILPIPPSPNLPNQLSIYLYPSLCFLEGTAMSEGRGTNLPFQIYGHPNYSDTTFSFVPVSIPGKSMHPKFKNERCFGKNLSEIKLETVRSWKTINWSYLIDAFEHTKVDVFFNRTDFFNLLEGRGELIPAIKNHNFEELKKNWDNELVDFMEIRKRYLLY